MRSIARKLKQRFLRAKFQATKPSVDRIPHYWLDGPPECAGQRVFVFVTYAANGVIPEHARLHYEAWKAAGYLVVVVVCLDDIEAGIRTSVGDVSAVMIRQNRGYDFGAWGNAISSIPTLTDAELCVISNDSVYGPLCSVQYLSHRIIDKDADLVGLVDSLEKTHHYQSFLLAFGPRALKSAFWRMWYNIKECDREEAILNYELRIAKKASQFGLSAKSLYHWDDPYSNPTLSKGIDLVRDGFPYIKVKLLKENPHGADINGWRSLLASLHYDVSVIDRHLQGQAMPS